MADEMVRRAQRFVNATYNNGATLGISKLDENGQTSWTVMHALTRALQYELGISALSNSFGPTTLGTIGEKYGKLDDTTIPSANLCRVIQAALYCKGYDGGEIDGTYNARVKASVAKLHQNMGVDGVYPGSALWPKTAKGLFNMDAYVTVGGGSDTIRSIQQWLNSKYILRKDYYVIPCDGHHSRDVAKSMLFAIQYELGMADGVANGVFGPGTQAGLKEHTLSTGASGVWVQLFSAAMVLNRRPASFASSFTSALASAVSDFQSFVKLPVTGKGDYSTWASLLVSYGDQNRKGAACDGVTQITAARAQTLKANGITYVGRYLTNPDPTPSGSTKEKAIQPGELKAIADNGLRCYPIYQTYGRGADDFSYPLGRAAAQAAINAALDHGFKAGTRIYFAVDFDALDDQVTNNVLPHFKGIQDAIADDGDRFKIGVYGPRNVCTRVGEAGHSSASFVSDMSSGFSGNFGYPLPADWAFDQIVTRTIGSGDGAINIDHNIASGRDTGQGSFDAPRSVKPDVRLMTLIEEMKTDVGKYMQSIGYPNDGGARTYQHWKCFDTVCVEHDELVTNLSNRHNMRKALIQATAYWEMRHVDPLDEAAELAVITTFNTTGKFLDQDPSTGIAQQRARTLIPAWNHALSKGYATGQPYRNPASDQDCYDIWKKARDNEEFALTSVCMIHRWDIDGKPGGDDNSPALRPPTLAYTDQEIYEVLRRYQGPAEPAFTDAKKRMPLYYILEKYHSISRNM
ncbi:glycoside hydrolase domain-containing protein [Streptomyces sp. URMC 123]|uniref:glycoside hydrolase domain-containing protein n=1 Tax=Streptomyces sp. URMC 123 TaxID=3423403 RepID=UPI003F1C974B